MKFSCLEKQLFPGEIVQEKHIGFQTCAYRVSNFCKLNTTYALVAIGINLRIGNVCLNVKVTTDVYFNGRLSNLNLKNLWNQCFI